MTGLTPRYRWVLPSPVGPSAELRAAGSRRGLSANLLAVLCRRGHRDEAALGALFDDPASGLHDPRLLPDARPFLDRIELARERGERILVCGDFDADGLTGLAILVRALRMLGLDAAPYVPDRSAEGHGLSVAAVERAGAEDRRLIVTVDCGVSSFAEIEAAASAGIDVLVTDHHRVPARVPPACAIVDPQRTDSLYPHTSLSGAGVAFKLAQLLLADEPGGSLRALELADLAAIGSLADMVPMVGENRCIVRLGLTRLARSPRPGLAALLRQAGVAADRIDPDAIGYGLAPRLNSVGRLGDAAPAAALLLTDEEAEAEGLAKQLQAANVVRREMTAVALGEARLALAGTPPSSPVIVVAGPWPVGIIGLVAGRLAEEAGRPAFVVSTAAEVWRGSARGPGLDLVTVLTACHDLVERYGGHAAAAGWSIRPERFEEFRQRIGAISADLPPVGALPPLDVDLVAHADTVGHLLFRDLAPLDGTGDPPVLVAIAGLRVVRLRKVVGGHLAVVLRKGREVLDGICFGRAAELEGQLQEGDAIDVVAHLSVRSWGGFDSLDLELRDLAPMDVRLAARCQTAAAN